MPACNVAFRIANERAQLDAFLQARHVANPRAFFKREASGWRFGVVPCIVRNALHAAGRASRLQGSENDY